MLPKFQKDLLEGQKLEDFILEKIKRKYPKAYRREGNFKGYDIYVPEKRFRIECKHDKKSEETANIAIEFEFNGRPSGIEATTATHWIYKFHDGSWKFAIGRTAVFRSLCEKKRWVNGGDGYLAKMYLVPKSELLVRKGISILTIKTDTIV